MPLFRSTSGGSFFRARPLLIASGVMLSLAAIPGLPKFSFFLLAAGTAFLAWRAPKICELRAAAARRAGG